VRSAARATAAGRRRPDNLCNGAILQLPDGIRQSEEFQNDFLAGAGSLEEIRHFGQCNYVTCLQGDRVVHLDGRRQSNIQIVY
jgi:hypothetical protein